MKPRYVIVKTNYNFDKLIEYVNEAVSNGYEPVGGPFKMGGDGCVWWGQAMFLRHP